MGNKAPNLSVLLLQSVNVTGKTDWDEEKDLVVVEFGAPQHRECSP